MLKMHLAEVSCQLARLFISAGADPDAVNKDGRTPMMVAILQVCYFSFYNNRAIFRSVDHRNDVVMAEFVFLFLSRTIFQETSQEWTIKKLPVFRNTKQTNKQIDYCFPRSILSLTVEMNSKCIITNHWRISDVIYIDLRAIIFRTISLWLRLCWNVEPRDLWAKPVTVPRCCMFKPKKQMTWIYPISTQMHTS